MRLTKAKYDFLKELDDAGEYGKTLLSMRNSLSWTRLAALERAGYLSAGLRRVAVRITHVGREALAAGRPSDLTSAIRESDPHVVRAAFEAGFTAGKSDVSWGSLISSLERWLASLD